MNKVELVGKIAEVAGSTKKDAGIALDSVIKAITEVISTGEEVNLVGFLKLSIKDIPAREARNPKTGEVIQLGETKRVVAKIGKTLKDSVK